MFKFIVFFIVISIFYHNQNLKKNKEFTTTYTKFQVPPIFTYIVDRYAGHVAYLDRA